MMIMGKVVQNQRKCSKECGNNIHTDRGTQILSRPLEVLYHGA
jgi:hypothetical protein